MNWDELKHIVSTINWQELHFLRPRAFYLFIPLGLISLLLVLANHERKKWKKIVQPALRPFMFSKGSVWAIVLPLLFFILGSSFTIIGLAGPTWEKKKLPGQKIQAVTLIALDLSRSMLATDIQPSRLERAKFKISDFLDANPRAKTGLLAFAGTAHPVLPFTSDYKLVKHHAEALVNRSMPVQGTDMPVLVQAIDSLMNKVGAPSTILLMTDAIAPADAVALENYIHGTPHHLEILLFSSPAGANVPGYPKVRSKQDPSVIQNLSQDSAVTVTPLTLDRSDVESIAARISKKLIFQKDDQKDEKEWEDMGWLLIIPALLLTLFWFRRGWVIQWCWLPLTLLMLSSCGVKSRHPDWWYSKGYQGQLLANAGQFGEAADRFEDIDHKATAYYKAGNYEAAADLFALDSSATAQYNRGLALARLGRYDEAMQAFGQAIDLDPSLKTAAEESLTKTKAAKQRADSALKYDAQSVGKEEKSGKNKKHDKRDSLKERKPQGEDEKLSADTRVKELPKFGNRATDEAASNIHRGKESDKPDLQPMNKRPKAGEQFILQQAAADPAEFLHKRFELQVKRYYHNLKKPAEPW